MKTCFCAHAILSLFDPLSVIKNVDEQGREVMAAELLEGPAPYGLPVVPIEERDGGVSWANDSN